MVHFNASSAICFKKSVARKRNIYRIGRAMIEFPKEIAVRELGNGV